MSTPTPTTIHEPPDLIGFAVADWQRRITELTPAVLEHDRLTRAIAAIDGLDRTGTATATRRRGRPLGRGGRALQAVTVLRDRGPLTGTDLARAVGVHPNYVYRILPGLAEQGLVEKNDDRTWSATREPANDNATPRREA